MAVTLALAGDTMLGRGTARALLEKGTESLFSDEIAEAARAADLFVLNLECCISDRGEPWPDPRKPFFFRAPPVAAEALAHIGVSCVTLANNHALDFGETALLDTIARLREAGIACVGAGAGLEEARAPVVVEAGGLRLGVIGFTDHPDEYRAEPGHPGVAFADLKAGVPDWLAGSIGAVSADAVLVTPHWGPNMTAEPVRHVRSAAHELLGAGATLLAGHSAHVFHGVEGAVLYDLGDFIDDYAVDPVLRNDLGLLFFVTLDERGPARLEGLPLKLEYCHTRVAGGEDAAWIEQRFRRVCAEFGSDVAREGNRLVVTWR